MLWVPLGSIRRLRIDKMDQDASLACARHKRTVIAMSNSLRLYFIFNSLK